jgi:hypothetical protein
MMVLVSIRSVLIATMVRVPISVQRPAAGQSRKLAANLEIGVSHRLFPGLSIQSFLTLFSLAVVDCPAVIDPRRLPMGKLPQSLYVANRTFRESFT